MYEPTGEETVVKIKVSVDLGWIGPGIHQIAVDDETYAHFINSTEIEVLEEVMAFSRLDPVKYKIYPEEQEGSE